MDAKTLEAMSPEELLDAFTGQKSRLAENEKWLAGVEAERELLEKQQAEALKKAGVSTVEELEALVAEEIEKLKAGIAELDGLNGRIETAKAEYEEDQDDDGNGTFQSPVEDEVGDDELDLGLDE